MARARVHFSAGDSHDDAVARALCCHQNTVSNIRRRCVTAGLPAAQATSLP
jgi:Fe-S cluster assembly scaffold protein SufB